MGQRPPGPHRLADQPRHEPRRAAHRRSGTAPAASPRGSDRSGSRRRWTGRSHGSISRGRRERTEIESARTRRRSPRRRRGVGHERGGRPVFRIDPHTGDGDQGHHGRQRPGRVAAGDDAVWVANRQDGTVFADRPRHRRSPPSSRSGGPPSAIAVGAVVCGWPAPRPRDLADRPVDAKASPTRSTSRAARARSRSPTVGVDGGARPPREATEGTLRVARRSASGSHGSMPADTTTASPLPQWSTTASSPTDGPAARPTEAGRRSRYRRPRAEPRRQVLRLQAAPRHPVLRRRARPAGGLPRLAGGPIAPCPASTGGSSGRRVRRSALRPLQRDRDRRPQADHDPPRSPTPSSSTSSRALRR